MRSLVIAFGALSALVWAAGSVSAQTYYYGYGESPRYYEPAPRYYGPPRYRPYDYDDDEPRYRRYPRREYYGSRGGNCYAGGCCPQGMTIQDGVCQPYRGR